MTPVADLPAQRPEVAATSGDLRVLVVQHQPGVSTGMIGEALVEQGVTLEVQRPYEEGPLPSVDELAGYDGLLILGGAMASWDTEAAPWIVPLRELVRGADESGIPTLGICLGHQITAAALGGTVDMSPAGPLIDLVPVGWTDEAADDPMVAGVGETFAVHGNRDVVVDPPTGASVLARLPDGSIQAARWGGNVWGVQFHPEAGPDLVERWVTETPEYFEGPGIDGPGLLAKVRAEEASLTRTAESLAGNFASLIRRRSTTG